jgi:hypothetical protein
MDVHITEALIDDAIDELACEVHDQLGILRDLTLLKPHPSLPATYLLTTTHWYRCIVTLSLGYYQWTKYTTLMRLLR